MVKTSNEMQNFISIIDEKCTYYVFLYSLVIFCTASCVFGVNYKQVDITSVSPLFQENLADLRIPFVETPTPYIDCDENSQLLWSYLTKKIK